MASSAIVWADGFITLDRMIENVFPRRMCASILTSTTGLAQVDGGATMPLGPQPRNGR
jgi:hypothetical protein